MTSTSIESLFDALIEGDADRLEDLLPPIRVRLDRLAKQRVRNLEDADEVVQETLRTLWEKRGSIQDPGHLLPFIFQTLRHKIGNVYLREKRQRARLANVSESQEAHPSQGGLHPEALLAAAEQDGIITRAIEMCSEENGSQGQILRLLQEGKTAAEIQGDLGGVQMGAVRTRICRARKRLKEVLSEEFHLEL